MGLKNLSPGEINNMGSWWMRKGKWNNRIPVEKVTRYLKDRPLVVELYQREMRGENFMESVALLLESMSVKVHYVDDAAIFCVAEDREVFELLSGRKVTWKWDSHSYEDFKTYSRCKNPIFQRKGASHETGANAEAHGGRPY